MLARKFATILASERVQAYWQAVLRHGPIAYWALAEPSGAVALDQVDAAQNAAYSNITLGGTGIGDYSASTSAAFNGTTSRVNLYTTSFRDAFSATAGSITIWGKTGAAQWTDGAVRQLFYISASSTNYIIAFKSSVNNTLQVRYRANNITQTVSITTSTTDWFHVSITWDKTADAVKVYFNGTQSGATQTGLGVWAGTLSSTQTGLGSLSLNNEVWNGSIGHCAVFDKVLSADDVTDLYTISRHKGRWAVPFEFIDLSYLGGSITYGSAASDVFATSWRALLDAYLPSSQVGKLWASHLSAASGQGSWYQLVRLQTEVIDYAPDAVFIDAAVNDSIEDALGTHEDGLAPAAEAVIRRLRTALPNARLYCWIFTWPENYSHLSDSRIASRDKWVTLAEHYGLHLLRWDEYLAGILGEGYTDAEVDAYLAATADVHLNDAGHDAAFDLAVANLSTVSNNPGAMPSYVYASAADYEGTPINRTGVDNDGETGTGWATSGSARVSSTANDTISWSGTFCSFGLSTNIGGGSGTLQYRIDSGSWVSLNLSLIGTSHYVVTSFPRGAHTVTLKVVSGTVQINKFLAV